MVAKFDLNYLSYFLINFQNSCAYLVANFLNFSQMSQLLQFAWVEADKRANNLVGTVLLDTLYIYILDLKNDCFRSGFVHKLHNQLEALTVTANDYVWLFNHQGG